MTRKENKAIEFLKELKNCYKKIVDSNPKGTKYCKMELEHIQTALNLIQRQQEEIEELKRSDIKQSKIECLEVELEKQKEDVQRMQELLDKSDANNYELRKETKKKDKIIDAMAIELYNYANLRNIIKCPAELENGNYNLENCKMNLADRNCILCIKQYFENKVESEDKQC